MSTDLKIILASGSAARRQMLEAAGLDFEVVPAQVNEPALRDHLRAEGAGASEIAMALAELKAARVAQAHPGALVIGADQLLVFEHEIMEKPIDIPAARRSLQHLSGKTHELISAAVIVRDGGCYWQGGETAQLTMRDLSPEFIENYLEAEGEALCECVGAYRLEGLGVNLFRAVEGNYFTVLGLPLLPLLETLREFGVMPE